MNLSHCLHSNLDQNGFCILCGFEIQSTIQLTNDLPINPPTTLPTNPPLFTKYKPIHFKKLNELDLITDYLNIKEYKPLILNELQTKSFSSRLSFKDKSLLCIYHILKEDSYPILFCDLQKFTKRILTCDYFKEFGNRNLKEDYLKNVYKRFNDRNDKSKESSYESFKDLIKKNLNKKIEVISMRYFLKEGNGICSERQIKRVDCGGVRGVKEDEGVEDRGVGDVEDKGINKDKDVKEDIKKSEVKVKFKKTKKSVKERIKEIKKILDA